MSHNSQLVLGVDVGTSSTKGVLVTTEGALVGSCERQHAPQRPHPGHVEMDATLWWEEFCSIAQELLGQVDSGDVVAVGVSGMGPCVALADAAGTPTRPAILYGVDTRATVEIEEQTQRYGGADAVIAAGGSILSTQAAGPKFEWVAKNEPEVFARSAKFFMPASYLLFNLTGEYVLDHQSASQCSPMYDIEGRQWHSTWAADIAQHIELPALAWANEAGGVVTQQAAAATGLPAGIPVTVGTIDAWSEAISVDAHNVGDLMLMYGTTMFFVNTVDSVVRNPALWGTIGALPGTASVAGGMATSGAVTNWLRELCGSPAFEELIEQARESGPGAKGLLMLPYFNGERTPIMDPQARGIIAGLSIDHGRGDIYRAALEATGFAVRHNIEAIRAAGGKIDRIVAVGGGTKGGLWTQIVSDISGVEQIIPEHTIGASFGIAMLAAGLVTDVNFARWNPPQHVVKPQPQLSDLYQQRYEQYLELYANTKDVSHSLAQFQVENS